MYTIGMNIVVGVLRGGPSHEYETSLATGNVLLSHLLPERYTPRDIFIDKTGVWHVAGRPVSPVRVLEMVDVVLVGLHGEYGEDGEVQKILERHGVPYSGSNSFASFLAMHKVFAKKYAGENKIHTPRYVLIESPDDIADSIMTAVRAFIPPVVVKPVRWGSSVGVSLSTGYPQVHEAAVALFDEGAQNVLLEEYVRGREASVGVIENFRGEELYTLPVAEIIATRNEEFLSSDVKKNDEGIKISCPATFSKSQKEELLQSAMAMHRSLGLRHYSRSDFIVTPHSIHYIETHSLPELAEKSIFPAMLEAVGEPSPNFTEHLINLALSKD
ncbi:MAG TPA: hypothetical protein ENI56_02395 [Candidatus Kaiserbacteria bacterium]|nr:hypothetical protein [Candidatus Kaiserbacteria bacterium]